MRYFVFLIFFLSHFDVSAQKIEPDYIKSIQLRPLKENQYSSIVPLGTTLELSFDDLEADQKNYYYKVQHMTHDWKASRLIPNQYIIGFQSNMLIDVENAFNTFQNYTHYKVRFPNQNTRITKSGNYLLSILDDNDNVVFNRRFTLYESAAVIGVQVSRSRNALKSNEEQTVQFTVNHPGIRINIPQQEIHVAVLQNQDWNTAITDLQPQFFRSNQLVYRYTNKTNFLGGNEYLNFDTKLVRNSGLNVRRVVQKDIFYSYLFPYDIPFVHNYTYNPDINGQFVIRGLEGTNSDTEADYSLVHFQLNSDKEFDKDVYVFGAFNNFELTENNRMIYDKRTKSYQKAILLKQGFYNYTYVTVGIDGEVNQAETRGNFSKTENEYTVIVYYKAMSELYDRVIGSSTIVFKGER